MKQIPFFNSKKKKLKEEIEALKFQAAQREQAEWLNKIEREKEARERDERARRLEQERESERQNEQRRRDDRMRQERAQQENRRLEVERQLELERQQYQRIQNERIRQEELRKQTLRFEAEQRAIAEKKRIERLQATTPKALCDLRDLVRKRYQLDMEIWSKKGVRGPDRHLVVKKMEMADAVLKDIYEMVQTWEPSPKLWTPEEWIIAQSVKERILRDGKRWWTNNPPWNES